MYNPFGLSESFSFRAHGFDVLLCVCVCVSVNRSDGGVLNVEDSDTLPESVL